MKNLNRIMIFFLLLALLYALYRYQQQINDDGYNSDDNTKRGYGANYVKAQHNTMLRGKSNNSTTQNKKTGNRSDRSDRSNRSDHIDRNNRDNIELIDDDSIGNISIDNVSQISLGSYGDMKSAHGGNNYKQDSIFDSLDSKDTVGLLLDNESAMSGLSNISNISNLSNLSEQSDRSNHSIQSYESNMTDVTNISNVSNKSFFF